MKDFEKKNIKDWSNLAEKELKSKGINNNLSWTSVDGIEFKSLYTKEDLEGLVHLDSMPGFAPYVRGPKATMYYGRPWTIRQYAGFSTAEESNKFYREALA